MNRFERFYHTEPIRESDCDREHASIELSDEEMLKRRAFEKEMLELGRYRTCSNKDYDGELIYRPPCEHDMSDAMKKKFAAAKELCKESWTFPKEEPDEKSARKKAKSKPKKDHPKRHIPAVESVQEEL